MLSDLRIHTHQMNKDRAVWGAFRTSHSGNWQKFKTARIMPPQQLIQQQQQGVMALTLLQASLQVFSGNPIDYLDFICTCKDQVERKTPTLSARLYYLVQHTTAPVQELTKSCLSMREDKGYQEARRLLKERYGQSYKIAAAHVKRLVDVPAIRADDGSALQQYSIQLTSCVDTLREIGCISKLDSHDNLRRS